MWTETLTNKLIGGYDDHIEFAALALTPLYCFSRIS